MKKINRAFFNFWNEDRSLTVLMLLLMLFIFVFVPIMGRGRIGEIIFKFIYSIILISGIFSVVKRKSYLPLAIVFIIIGLSINWFSEIETTNASLIANNVGAILFNLFFAFAIFIKTFQPGDITFHRIEGSVVVYLLLGLVFAYSFHVIYLVYGITAFNNIQGPEFKDFLYFSFTSLTTMGYGDITPVHSVARSVANFEAVIGQLYPAILIARLVSMEFESSIRKKGI